MSAEQDKKPAVVAIVSALVIAGALAWFDGTQKTTDNVQILGPQVTQNTQRIEDAEEWQDNWAQGELPIDIDQSLRVAQLEHQLDDAEDRIDQLQEMVNDVRVALAGEGIEVP